MYIVTVLFKNTEHVVEFNYNKFADGDSIVSAWKGDKLGGEVAPVMEIEDDFGSKARFRMSEISAVILCDLDRQLEAIKSNQLSKARTEIKVRSELARDPAARVLMSAPPLTGNA